MAIVHSQSILFAKPWTSLVLLGLAVVLLGGTGCKATGEGEGDGFFDGAFDFPPTPTEAVAMAVDKDDPDRRRQGILWISASTFGGEEVYVELYRLFHNDPHPNVRAAVAVALGRHGTVEDANLLILLLQDEQDFTRWQAASALRKVHNPAAAEPLTRRLDIVNEPDANVRRCAAEALGQYASIPVFNSLVVALEDRDFAVVEAAYESLKTLTGYDAGLDPRDWSAWSANNAGSIFENQQQYTYQPYNRPHYWIDYVFIWSSSELNQEPTTPRGL